MKEDFAAILAECISQVKEGKSTIEECLVRYPHLGGELKPLLELANRIQPEEQKPSPEFRIRARNHLLKVMESPKGKKPTSRFLGPLTMPLRLGIPIAIALVVLVSGSGTLAYASQKSLPNQSLYPLKKGIENLQSTLTFGHEARANRHLELADRRVEEVVIQSRQGYFDAGVTEEIAQQLNAAFQDIGRVAEKDRESLLVRFSESAVKHQVKLGEVLITANETDRLAVGQAVMSNRQGSVMAEVASANPSFFQKAPSLAEEEFEKSYFKITGVRLDTKRDELNVGGILVPNVKTSLEIPPVGSNIELRGLVQGGETFISRVTLHKSEDGEVELEGIYGGTSPDGAFWRVGGILIARPQDINPPFTGKKVELSGRVVNDRFVASELEDEEAEEDEEESREVKIHGILAGINADKTTMVLESGAARIVTDISKAELKTKDGRTLKISDLSLLVGEDITVKVNRLEDKLMWVGEVSVAVGKKSNPRDEQKEDNASNRREESRGNDKTKGDLQRQSEGDAVKPGSGDNQDKISGEHDGASNQDSSQEDGNNTGSETGTEESDEDSDEETETHLEQEEPGDEAGNNDSGEEDGGERESDDDDDDDDNESDDDRDESDDDDDDDDDGDKSDRHSGYKLRLLTNYQSLAGSESCH